MVTQIAAPSAGSATGSTTTQSESGRLAALHNLGQSIWLDNISRSLIQTGELGRLADEGVLGVTSNPTIFEKAIAGSADYDAQLAPLARTGKDPESIFEALAISDIQDAADVLRPVYDRLDGADGYVSLEVSPRLARDTAGTAAAATRLFAAVGRPNVMIKIPATIEGLPAIADAIGQGINVNVTLLFDVDRYEAVANAYIEGLERLAAAGNPLDRVASVASFFVSRVDTLVDSQLGDSDVALKGQAAIANAKLAYERFERIFSSERFAGLRAKGARVQRMLWASTSTKNPAFPDTMYVDPLIGPDTINTVPPQTLDAIRARATVRVSIREGLSEAHALARSLVDAGIDLKAVAARLEQEGVASFAKSFDDLLASIEKKAAAVTVG
ncbi:MAG: Transaldolase [uncultured Chloroflexi bacterium]|uniref:Transaldolase n=1 Tax=uncultured Chloroflexota bacterium TaxID=166587 RepID=A0A6J4K7A6_9CHLR|nr:MAG: Transaldolase [uncultured Chloroflexota bacterium]